MHLTRSVRIGLGLLVGVALFAASAAQAADGRDFAGFYELRNATDLGEEVSLTLSLRVFNYSDAIVHDATVTLEDPVLSEIAYASFSIISLADKASVDLEGDVTIPQREYQSWQEGGTPSVRIEFTDPAGNPVRRMIELLPMIVKGGLS